MPCAMCGSAIAPDAAFCGFCGAAVGAAPHAKSALQASVLVDTAVGPEVRHTGTQATAVTPTQQAAVGPRRVAARDVTRYLCAAAYLDREYARLLVRQISAEPHLAVAPAPECDVPVVLCHAYGAIIRRRHRDLLLAVLLALAIVSLFLQKFTLFLLPLFLAWATVLVFDYSTRFGRHLQSLRPGYFKASAAPAPPNRKVAARLRQIGDYAAGNVTVYSGFSPFVGYGIELDSWSFALDVTKPAKDGDAPVTGFDVTEIYDYIASRLKTLILPDLQVTERLFVDGSTIIDDERFLSDPFGRPRSRVSTAQVDALKREPEDRARPYLAVHSTGWGGELVYSLFLRFNRSESNLFVEANHTALAPLLSRYKIIDSLMPHPSVADLWSLFKAASVNTWIDLPAAPLRVARSFDLGFRMASRVGRQNRMIGELRWFDYGARLSVRQQASDTVYQRYFQKLDNDMAMKVAQKRVLDALIEFADDHGIDTADLVERQNSIINNGIIASGDAQVKGNALASGESARASVRTRRKRAD